MLLELLLNTKQRWALTDATNKDVVAFRTIISIDIKNDNQVSEYPLEKGSFASYNKTSSPIMINMTAAIEGALSSLQPVVDRLEQLAISTELLSVVTPVKEYANMNLINCNYSHKVQDGISAIYFELQLKEIKLTEAQYTTGKVITPAAAKNPSSASNQNTGKKQSSAKKGKDALTNYLKS